MSFGDRWNVFWGTFFLLLVPSLLAFLTSYNTPRKVLSCRSINYVVYVASQLAAMACWVWEVRLKVRYGARCKPLSEFRTCPSPPFFGVDSPPCPPVILRLRYPRQQRLRNMLQNHLYPGDY